MKLNKNYHLRSIAGQGVLVATGEAAKHYNGLMTVSPSGEFILKNYENADDIASLIDMVYEEFNVDKATAASDVISFTKTMLEMGFIEMEDPEKRW